MSSKVLQTSPAFLVQDKAASPMGVLRLVGPDAARFLQGQVTQDVAALPSGQWARAALCTAQGRVLALLKVVAVPEGLWLVLPAERIATLREHLQRFVLRAKVKLIADDGLVVSLCAGSGQVPAERVPREHNRRVEARSRAPRVERVDKPSLGARNAGRR